MDPQQMLQAAAGPLLGVFGGALQFLRGRRSFPEPAYHALALVLAAGAYFLTADFLRYWAGPVGVQLTIVLAILGIAGNVAAVWGGTFAASNAAKAGAPLIPMTNSK